MLILEVDDIVGDTVVDAIGITVEQRMMKIDVRDISLPKIAVTSKEKSMLHILKKTNKQKDSTKEQSC